MDVALHGGTMIRDVPSRSKVLKRLRLGDIVFRNLTRAAAIAVLVILAFMTWDQMRQLQSRLDDRLPQIENRLAQLSTKVDQAASRAPAAANQGPDPNRIYPIKTAGMPARGPQSAPVTIAEFSDFQ